MPAQSGSFTAAFQISGFRMNLLQKVNSTIKQYCLVHPDERLLIAVSGGIDSMVLLHLMKQSGYHIGVAHMNFSMRGNDSELDMELVKNFCSAHDITLYIKKVNTIEFADDNQLSIQMAARKLRYTWFNEILEENNYQRLVTAHHADDQAETVLLQLLRGLPGLSGMKFKSDKLIRPLLHIPKTELIQWAEAHHVPYRNDASNDENDYQRNYLRNKIIPLLLRINPSLTTTLVKSAEINQDQNELLLYAVREFSKDQIIQENDLVRIKLDELKTKPGFRTILHFILLQWKFNPHVIQDLIDSIEISGRKFVSSTHILTTARNELIIEERKADFAEDITINHLPFHVETPFGTFSGANADVPDQLNNTASNIMYADAEKLRFPLTVRSWKNGDSFHPLGMKGRKKISDLFTDEKLSIPEKKRVPVFVSDNRVAWVCGFRMDENFRITADTRSVVKIVYAPSSSERA